MRPSPDIRRIRTFRNWVPVFDVLDHESGSTIAAMSAAESTVLTGLALIEGRLVHGDPAGLTMVTFLALAALGAALAMAAGEALAWLLARPVGRDVARAAASLERARVAVARIGPIVVADDVDLAPYATRYRARDRRPGEVADRCGRCHHRLRGDAGPRHQSVALQTAAGGGASHRSRGRGIRRPVPSPPLDRCLSVEPAAPRGTHQALAGLVRRRAARG